MLASPPVQLCVRHQRVAMRLRFQPHRRRSPALFSLPERSSLLEAATGAHGPRRSTPGPSPSLLRLRDPWDEPRNNVHEGLPSPSSTDSALLPVRIGETWVHADG